MKKNSFEIKSKSIWPVCLPQKLILHLKSPLSPGYRVHLPKRVASTESVQQGQDDAELRQGVPIQIPDRCRQ